MPGIICTGRPKKYDLILHLHQYDESTTENCGGSFFEGRGIIDNFGAVTMKWVPNINTFTGDKEITFDRTIDDNGSPIDPPVSETWRVVIFGTDYIIRSGPRFSLFQGGWKHTIGQSHNLVFLKLVNGQTVDTFSYNIDGDFNGEIMGDWWDPIKSTWVKGTFTTYDNPPTKGIVWRWFDRPCCASMTADPFLTHPAYTGNPDGPPDLVQYPVRSFETHPRPPSACHYVELQFENCKEGAGNLGWDDPEQ